MAQGRPRDAGEILVEGWLAFVRAACVKWIDSQNVSRDDLTEMCLRAFDCALGSPTSRVRDGAAFSRSRSLSRLASWAFSPPNSLRQIHHRDR